MTPRGCGCKYASSKKGKESGICTACEAQITKATPKANIVVVARAVVKAKAKITPVPVKEASHAGAKAGRVKKGKGNDANRPPAKKDDGNSR